MYKIIKDNKIVDVIKYADFIRFLPSGLVVRTSESLAQGVVGSDEQTIYHLGATSSKDSDYVSIEMITPEEFSRLQNLLNSGQDVYADESILAFAKRDVIKHLSNVCKNKIIAGFKVKLSDGDFYHFQLTAEDQLNLLSIEAQITAGVESFIYHATGQPSRLFSRADMTKVIRAFRKHVQYQTTYFNIAKQYITSLSDVEKVKLFKWGTDVSEATDDVVLKQILKDRGDLA